ncbi:conserved hypothetical protein [Trichinella spiralis]|uniref:hypothetical protein n=1 Tax=Trichinella spiralis TaxID=6334 RepID=UPI0001EFD3B6|nr:conserved hypothetical protein [Trichinella spiralis]
MWTSSAHYHRRADFPPAYGNRLLHPLAGGSALNQHRYRMSGVPVSVGSRIWNSDHRHHRPRPAVPECSVARNHHCVWYQVGTGVSISPTDQRNGRKVPSTFEDRPSSARVSLTSVDRSSSPGAAWHPQQRERRSQARTGRTGLWIAATPAWCILHQNIPLERRSSQRPPTDPLRLHSTDTVKSRRVAEIFLADRVEELHARLRAEHRSTTTPIADVRRTVLGAELRRLDRVKPAFLDSGDAPHVRNMQLSPPRSSSQKRRRVTFARPIEVIS